MPPTRSRPSFADSTSSSISTELPQSPASYLRGLQQRRDAIRNSGLPFAADHEEESVRVAHLRKRVTAIVESCSYGTSDNRWDALGKALSLRCTVAGKHFIYVDSLKPAILAPAGGWPATLPENEEEWAELRKKTAVIQKVQGWARNVEAETPRKSPAKSPKKSPVKAKGKKNASDVVEVKSYHKRKARDMKDPSPLGFVAAKRTTASTSGKGAPYPKDREVTPSAPSAVMSSPPKALPLKGASPANASSSRPPTPNKAAPAGPEVSSSPTHVESTSPVRPPRPSSSKSSPSLSTPNAPALPGKATSINELPEGSFFPPSFPSNLDTSTPHETGKRRPAPIGNTSLQMVSSPLIVEEEDEIAVALGLKAKGKGKEKRPRSPSTSPGAVETKRARLHDDDQGTPQKMTDLRDLLTSARTPSPKKRTPSAKTRRASGGEVTPSPSPSKPGPSKAPSLVPSISRPPSKRSSTSAMPQPQPRQTSQPLYLGVDISSPARSLSSIAGGDSDEEDEEDGIPMTKEERQALLGGGDMPAGTQLRVFESQYDVDNEMDDFQGFLENDVSLAGIHAESSGFSMGGGKGTMQESPEDEDDDDVGAGWIRSRSASVYA